MNPIEAVEYMKSGSKVSPKGWDGVSYKMCHQDKIIGLTQLTSCAANVLGVWSTDQFIKDWYEHNYNDKIKIELLPI